MVATEVSASASHLAGGAATLPPRGPRRRRAARRDWGIALTFLAPALIALIALRLLPTGTAVTDSFKQDSLSAEGGTFAGLQNYVDVLTDPLFLDVVRITALFLVITVPVQIVAALFLALVLVERIRGVGFIRVLIFLPVAAPGAVAASIWGIAFQPRGPLNAVLTGLGMPAQPFLTSPDQALLAFVVLLSWIGVGYWTIFLLAGLQDIPAEQYEAAAIDGAGYWRSFWSVTLPNLRRPLAFVIVGNTVANVLTFVPVQILTKGGPAGSTRLYMFDIYNNAFGLADLNFAQTQVVILLVFLIAIVAVQFRLLSRGERA